MHEYVHRKIHREILENLRDFPAIGILGPRQCGKTTLAHEITKELKNSIYLDLEKPSDLRKLQDAELYFQIHKGKLICLDEIQRVPDLFPVLRSVIDQSGRNGQFMILGSASRDLIRQSSESLAGRIAYTELTPFLFSELIPNSGVDADPKIRLWQRGGFPRSFLARGDKSSFRWRDNFIRTFLERDIPQLGFNIPAETLRRLWSMLAHNHGQLLNSSRLGESLGVSHVTIRSYIDLLAQTFMVRVLLPYTANLKKRMVKSPRTYIRDSGILHALLEIESHDTLLGHPVYGTSWEGFVIENVASEFPDWHPWFFRTSNRAELDLVLTKGTRMLAVECKASTAPQVTKGFWNALKDLEIKEAWIIAPVGEAYPIKENVFVAPPGVFIKHVHASS